MHILSALCGVLLALSAFAKEAPPTFEQANEAYQKLRGDAERRKLKHHWLNVARRFEKWLQKNPRHERAPQALFALGQLYADLSRLSGDGDDQKAARQALSKLVALWPKHALADGGRRLLEKLKGAEPA